MDSETCPIMSIIASFNLPASAILEQTGVAKVMEPALDASRRAYGRPGGLDAQDGSLRIVELQPVTVREHKPARLRWPESLCTSSGAFRARRVAWYSEELADGVRLPVFDSSTTSSRRQTGPTGYRMTG